MTYCKYIKALVEYGVNSGLLPEAEQNYSINQLLEVLEENEYQEPDADSTTLELEEILAGLLDFAAGKELLKADNITGRDLFDARLMNCLVPRPAQIISEFNRLYQESPVQATDYFYKLSQDSDYIRRYRMEKDIRWAVESPYGAIDISINLAKPEKDPLAIAEAGMQKQTNYPQCQLCMENEGYAGRMNHPARQNHRIIPIRINNSEWGFQYSPYVYYNEHCIVLNRYHIPMKIERDTFVKLLDFVELFPHYFLGSNADLPVVGGSILSHDHYQGGNYRFAMARAPMEREMRIPGFEDVAAGIVRWPLSVLRIRGKKKERLISLAEHILDKWRGYSDEGAGILAQTSGELHNTITPIARKIGGAESNDSSQAAAEWFELDLTLRNNRTDAAHPLGIFHPHEDKHHIKKENIGLIEVMGLAILPARLKVEMELLAEYILAGKDIAECDQIEKHADWVTAFLPAYPNITSQNIMDILQDEIGKVFVGVLEDAGVFKCTSTGREAFIRFVDSL